MPTGITKKSTISTVAFLDKRETLNKVLDIKNEEMSFLDVLELSGRSRVTTVPQYGHFVNESKRVIGTASAVTGSGSAQVVATVDATAAANAIVSELVLFPDGKVGRIQSISGNDLTIRSVDGTNLTLVGTNKLSFFSQASGEGSLSPASKRWGMTRYQNQVQVFKAKYDITDIQKASQVEVEFNGKPYIIYKGQHEALMKFREDISAALLFSRISNTTFGDSNPALVDAEGNAVQTTMGLDQYVTTYGVDQSLTTGGVLAGADLVTLTQTLNKLRCPLEYFVFMGTAQNIAWDNYFNALGNSGISTQARFSVDGRDLDFGIDSVKIYGRTYHKKYLPILDHAEMINYTGSPNFKDAAYGIPAGKIKTVDGQVVDRFGVRYMDGDGTNLRYREIQLGGLADTPTNERSVLEFHYHSVQGLEILGAQHTFKLK